MVVGKLMHIAQERRDVTFAVKEVARKMKEATTADEIALKRVGRYLKKTPDVRSHIEVMALPSDVVVHTDSDWGGQAGTRKSTSGGTVSWGDCILSGWSRTQPSVSLSSCEAEMYALTIGIAEGLLAKHLLQELGLKCDLRNHVDSVSAKAWVSKRGLGRMKHVELRYMFIQDVVAKGMTTVCCVNTRQNKADVMTKSLTTRPRASCDDAWPGRKLWN